MASVGHKYLTSIAHLIQEALSVNLQDYAQKVEANQKQQEDQQQAQPKQETMVGKPSNQVA